MTTQEHVDKWLKKRVIPPSLFTLGQWYGAIQMSPSQTYTYAQERLHKWPSGKLILAEVFLCAVARTVAGRGSGDAMDIKEFSDGVHSGLRIVLNGSAQPDMALHKLADWIKAGQIDPKKLLSAATSRLFKLIKLL